LIQSPAVATRRTAWRSESTSPPAMNAFTWHEGKEILATCIASAARSDATQSQRTALY